MHLGQDDLPPEAARQLLGADAIIGYSTHNLEQAIRAAALPVNYVAIGPVFATASKLNPDPVVGTAGVATVRAQLVGMPLVAIGGITRESYRAVIEAGADSIAVIGDLLGDANRITVTMQTWLKVCR